MDALRIAAFSYKNKGGNPAGVVIGSEMPTELESPLFCTRDGSRVLRSCHHSQRCSKTSSRDKEYPETGKSCKVL